MRQGAGFWGNIKSHWNSRDVVSYNTDNYDTLIMRKHNEKEGKEREDVGT